MIEDHPDYDERPPRGWTAENRRRATESDRDASGSQVLAVLLGVVALVAYAVLLVVAVLS